MICPCGRPTSAGRTEEDATATQCLICEVAESLSTFTWKGIPRPGQALYRMRHAETVLRYQAARREAQRIYWKGYYEKNKKQIQDRRKLAILRSLYVPNDLR